jgi:hypothetical protein
MDGSSFIVFFRPSTSLRPTIDSTGRSPSHPKSPERLSSPASAPDLVT